MRKIFLVLVVFALAFMFSGASYSAEMKVGYVDFEKVFNEYVKTKSEDTKLKANLEKKKAELDKKGEEINKMKSGAELLGEEAKKAKEKEIVAKITELKKLRQEAEEELLKARNEKWLEIFNEIKAIASKYGKEKGYTFIFDEKALVFKADGLDLTEDIIKLINVKK